MTTATPDATLFHADDPASVWQVAEGEVDLFLVFGDPDGGHGRWHPLVSCAAPALLPGLPPGEFTMIGRCAPGARVERLQITTLDEVAPADQAALGTAVDNWLGPVLERLSRGELPPREFRAVEPGEVVAAEADQVLRPVGGPLWVSGAGLRLRGRAASRILEPGEIAPVGRWDWMVADGAVEVTAIDTAALIASGRLRPMLELTAVHALQAIRVALASEDEAERDRIAGRLARDAQLAVDTNRDLAHLVEGTPRRPGGLLGGDDLLTAVGLVAGELGAVVRRPPPSAGQGRRVDQLAEIVRASGLYSREVKLGRGWFREDAGPLLGFVADDGRPVALLRRTFGYELHDPRDGSTRRVTADVAGTLAETGRALYRQLPDRPLRGRDLLRFGATGTRRDVVTFLVAALAVAGLSLLVPLASGQVLGTLVPNGERDLVTRLCLGLVVAALATALFAAVQNLAALRVEGRLQARMQEGLWGRVLRMPPRFFRRWSVGDLATRALALTQVQELLGTLGTKVAVAMIGLVVNLALVVVYAPGLGVLSVVLFAVVGVVTAVVIRRSLRIQRQAYDHQREVNSRAFQLMGHVGKLRAAAAEERAFAFWAEAFGDHRDRLFAARRIQNRFAGFAASFALLSYATVFLVAGTVAEPSSTTFFVFSVAYAQAMAALLVIVVTAVNAVAIVPMLEGLRPILEAVPEDTNDRSDPGELTGRIEVTSVTFGYQADSGPVLQDVSLRVEPGEFVAIVGQSGSGKSTLLRLMLGFESPDAGAVLYDEHDLAGLDVAAVRRQCGVVLQDSQLFAGDILSNVVGSGVYTADDAWEAIEMVGLDEEVAAMPMGMFTVIAEGAGTLSGGQRQRVALARALVARPRVVFLDEATSALDNVTQAQVMNSMRRMQATRVVVAHRLSTIRSADRIVVMEAGRVVEEGSYDALIAQGGAFKRLAERQLA